MGVNHMMVPDDKPTHETKVIVLDTQIKGLNADRVCQRVEIILAEQYAQGWRMISLTDGLAFLERPLKEAYGYERC